ncbi:MAG: AMP-binding protein [Clostridia bacterium]|nr:AMP-binding protein [Clostridia bacterium]
MIKKYNVEPISTIKEMQEKAVAACPDRLNYRYREGKKIIDVTFKEFYELTLNLGAALHDLGTKDKHIACIGDNSFNWITVLYTVLKSDAVFVPIDKELPVKDIIYVLNHSESDILFYAKRYEKVLDEIKKECPKVKTYISFDADEDNGDVLSYKKLIEKGKKLYSEGKFKEEEHDTNVLKEIIYTSGTTGLAKGVMLTEHNLVSVVTGALEITTLEDVALSVLPYHHTYEASCDLLIGMHNHTTICINDSLKNVLPNLQEFKPSLMMIVPAFAELFYKKIWATAEKEGKANLLRKMLKISAALRKIHIDLRGLLFKSVRNAFGGNLKQLISGGAPLRSEIGDFFNGIGILMQNGYGITECSPLVSVNVPTLNDPSTVGIPLSCCEVKTINNTEEGIGEICVKGDIVMMGYYKDEEKTKDALQDGWFNTGDYGCITDKGQIKIVGRKKNFFVLENGKNVYPEEIENYILAIPYVQETIVKASTNEYGMNGNNLVAEVFLNAEAVKGLGDIDIVKKLKDDINEKTKELPVYKRISDIIIRDKEFEKTTTNKIKR